MRAELVFRAGGQRRVRPARPKPGLLRDRRGVAAVMFAASASVLVGFAGLSTEAGAWYLARRDAQTVTDAAAQVAAARLGFTAAALGYALAGQQADAAAAAIDVAARNGYATGAAATTVSVNAPPASGAFLGDARAIEVVVERHHARILSRLSLGAGATVIRTRAVAVLQDLHAACALSLGGNLIIGGNTTTTDPTCVLASNAIGASAINVIGQPTIAVAGLSSAGGCNNCDRTTSPVLTNQLGAPDPMAARVAAAPQPDLGRADVCGATPNTTEIANAGASGWSPPTLRSDVPGLGGYHVFCRDLLVGAGGRVNLVPGTYYFRGTDLQLTSGTLDCSACAAGGPGVTLVFAPNPNNGKVGGVTINAQASTVLNAPATGPYRGVLLYRTASNTIGGATEVSIAGSSATRLAGGVYAPGADVTFNGNADIAQTGCLFLVAGTVTLSGSAGSQRDCSPAERELVPRVQIARLRE